MRLFVALDVDAAAREALRVAIARLCQRVGSDDLRWTDADNLHCTLHFLGEVDASRLPDLREALGTSLAIAPFDAATGEVGTFPPSGPLRVVWLAIDDGAASIRAVHAAVGDRLQAAGCDVDARPFMPHLTLARTRRAERRGGRALRDRVAGLSISPLAWRVGEIALYSSDLSGARPRYTVEHRVALVGAAASPVK